MDASFASTEPPHADSTQTSGEKDALATFTLWLTLNLYILETAASAISIWWLCLRKDWKPNSACTLNLAVAEFLTFVFGNLLPALHEAILTVFSFPSWITLISNLGYNGCVILMMAISVERSLTLLFKRVFSHLQTKHYFLLCTFLWGLTFLQTEMEYKVCLEDTETENVTGEELMEDYEMQPQKLMEDIEMPCPILLSFQSTLELVDFIAFMVVCVLEIFRRFRQERHRSYAKLYAAARMTGLLALATVSWVQDYISELFREIVPLIFLLFDCCRHKEWKFKQHFKKLWQKLCQHTPEVIHQRGDGTISTAV